MRYHVQVGRGFRVARELNLTEQELRVRVLTPWSRGEPVALGEREWDPADAELAILAGPELDGPQLAMGQGWHNAQRTGEDVTARLLHASQGAVALLAQSDESAQAAAALLAALGLETIAWDRGRTATQAVLVVLDAHAGDGTAAWWLEVGLALGKLGERALLAVHGGDAPPPPLAGAAAIRLDDAEAAAQALSQRLRS